MALLYSLVALGQRVAVAHVHHGLRGDAADADLRFVEARSGSLGVRFFASRVDAGMRDGRSPEARARTLRYAALEEIRRREQLRFVATAHTLDDQAETVLLRSIRGTGLGGLAGIAPRSLDGRLLRPLLTVRREELREYLRARCYSWREDLSNQDLLVPRNRIRAEVLPVLEAIHPGASRKLAELAECAGDHRREASRALEPLLARIVEAGDGGLWFDPAAVTRLPEGSRPELLSALLVRVGLRDRVSRIHLRRIEAFLEAGVVGKTLSLPEETVILQDRGQCWLGHAPGPVFPPAFRAELRPPQPLLLPQRDTCLVWRQDPVGGRDAMALLLPEPLPGPLIARSPVPGDRIRPPGSSHSRDLKDLLTRARWSQRERARAVVVELAREVVWVVGLLRSDSVDGAKQRCWQLVAERLSAQRAN